MILCAEAVAKDIIAFPPNITKVFMKVNQIDFSHYTGSELKKLLQAINKEISKRHIDTKKNVLKEIQKAAGEAGLSLADLFPGVVLPVAKRGPKVGVGSKLVGIKIAPKFRHPGNADLVWSGRGLAPLWVNEWLSNGGAYADLEIQSDVTE